MKRVMLVLMIMSLVFVGVVSCWAEEEKPTAGADIGVFTKYIWRGEELNDDTLVIQPSASIGYKGFGFNLWGNLDLGVDYGPTTTTSQFTETDMTFSYDTSYGPWSLGLGYIYYALDGAYNDTQELYVSLGYDIILAPTLTIYRDIDHLNRWYLNLGVSHSFDISNGITLDLAGSIGYYISDDIEFLEIDDNLNPKPEKYRGFHDGLLTAGLTIPLNKYFTLSPMVGYSFPLTGNAENYMRAISPDNDSDFFYGGLTLSFAF